MRKLPRHDSCRSETCNVNGGTQGHAGARTVMHCVHVLHQRVRVLRRAAVACASPRFGPVADVQHPTLRSKTGLFAQSPHRRVLRISNRVRVLRSVYCLHRAERSPRREAAGKCSSTWVNRAGGEYEDIRWPTGQNFVSCDHPQALSCFQFRTAGLSRKRGMRSSKLWGFGSW